MRGNKIRELSYYLFFGLMIFAKGIGLDSGDKLYYLLGAVACLCVGCKLALTKYSKKQIALMVFLCLAAFAAYRNSGRLGILLSVLAVIGMKDMDVKGLFRLGTVIYGLTFLFTVVAAKLGFISNPLVVHEKGGIEVIRWGMGYSTGNVFHISYFILAVLLCYTWEKRFDIKKLIGLMAGNLLVFLFSLSYTGVAVTAFYLLLNLYAVKRRRLCRAEQVICQLPLPLCIVFSLGAPLLLRYPLVQRLDGMLQARLTFSAYYLQNQPLTLLGARMKDVPNFWVIMDNGYVYILMTFGIVAFVLFCLGYAVLIARYSGLPFPFMKKESGGKAEEKAFYLQELAIIFSFLLYGIMEQFISNAFMNLSLLFMGELLFGSCRHSEGQEGETEKEARKEGDWQNARGISGRAWLFGVIIGCGILGFYLKLWPVREYVSVPLRSLNYIDAVSLQLQMENPGNDKDYLNQAMRAYGEAMEEPELLQKALAEAGVEKKLTVEELRAALEYSLPVFVHRDGGYHTFRVRLLKLYHDVAAEEYRALLHSMAGNMEPKGGAAYAALGDIYEERIGKSFGEDRIEHISEEKAYMVEKGGELVRIEAVRDGVFYAVMGMAAGVCICSRKKEREHG